MAAACRHDAGFIIRLHVCVMCGQRRARVYRAAQHVSRSSICSSFVMPAIQPPGGYSSHCLFNSSALRSAARRRSRSSYFQTSLWQPDVYNHLSPEHPTLSSAVVTSSTGSSLKKQDTSWINAELLQDAVGQEANVLHIDIQPATEKGDNMMGLLYRTRVEYCVGDSDKVLIKKFIIKTTPEGEYIENFVRDFDFFGREAAVYKALEKMYSFADSRLKGRSFKRFSTAHYPSSRRETLIINDLIPLGFKHLLTPKSERLDLAHAKIVVQNLARLHCLSVTYLEENPCFLDSFVDMNLERKNQKRLHQICRPMIKSVSKEVHKWEGFSEIAKKLESMGNEFAKRLTSVCLPEKAFINVLIHGDCWVNNIFFKYSDCGEPIDFLFIDFQSTRKGSPVFDLSYFLLGSIQTHIRNNHWNDLLREYCEAFECVSEELDYSGPTITLKDLCEEIKRTAIYGFNCALTTTAVVLSDPDDPPDLGKLTEAQVDKGDYDEWGKMYSTPAFRKVFQELLIYFEKLGIFD